METNNEREIEASLKSAAAIAILVHGVGDHSQINLLKIAEEGFKVVGGQRSETIQLRLPGVMSSDLTNVLRLDDSDESYFVFPFVWSRSRQRLIEATEATSVIPLHFIWKSIQAFDNIGVNFFQCVYQTSGWRRMTMLLVAIFFSALTFSFLWACALIVAWQVKYVLRSDPGPSLLLLGVLWLVPVAVGLAWWLVNELLDFVADVVAYVASPIHRATQLDAVRRVLAWLSGYAPSARLLVVGHSLGSIVVSHSLIDPPAELRGTKRVLLVTLGSPLTRLARWFPRVIQSPEQLQTAYEASGCLNCWVNFWRKGDRIGRAIELKSDSFAEANLGEGGHTNYWRDQRLWGCIANLLKLDKVETLQTVAATWLPQPDWRAIERERQRRIAHHVLMQKIAAVLFFLILAMVSAGLTRYRSALLVTGHATAFGAICGGAFLLWLALVLVNAGLGGNDAHAGHYSPKFNSWTKFFTVVLATGIACLWGWALALFYWAAKG